MAMMDVSLTYSDIAVVLMVSNSAVNPVLYGLYKKDFRYKLKKLFKLKENRLNITPNNSTKASTHAQDCTMCSSNANIPLSIPPSHSKSNAPVVNEIEMSIG